MNEKKKEFDLEKRTLIFGKNIVKLCKTIEVSRVSEPLIKQLVRSGTSVGANYFEANGASSRKDFINKIYICKKESKETCYWLEIIDEYCKERSLYNLVKQEATELTKIFSKISLSKN